MSLISIQRNHEAKAEALVDHVRFILSGGSVGKLANCSLLQSPLVTQKVVATLNVSSTPSLFVVFVFNNPNNPDLPILYGFLPEVFADTPTQGYVYNSLTSLDVAELYFTFDGVVTAPYGVPIVYNVDNVGAFFQQYNATNNDLGVSLVISQYFNGGFCAVQRLSLKSTMIYPGSTAAFQGKATVNQFVSVPQPRELSEASQLASAIGGASTLCEKIDEDLACILKGTNEATFLGGAAVQPAGQTVVKAKSVVFAPADFTTLNTKGCVITNFAELNKYFDLGNCQLGWSIAFNGEVSTPGQLGFQLIVDYTSIDTDGNGIIYSNLVATMNFTIADTTSTIRYSTHTNGYANTPTLSTIDGVSVAQPWTFLGIRAVAFVGYGGAISDLISGSINCGITVLTPIATPDRQSVTVAQYQNAANLPFEFVLYSYWNLTPSSGNAALLNDQLVRPMSQQLSLMAAHSLENLMGSAIGAVFKKSRFDYIVDLLSDQTNVFRLMSADVSQGSGNMEKLMKNDHMESMSHETLAAAPFWRNAAKKFLGGASRVLDTAERVGKVAATAGELGLLAAPRESYYTSAPRASYSASSRPSYEAAPRPTYEVGQRLFSNNLFSASRTKKKFKLPKPETEIEVEDLVENSSVSTESKSSESGVKVEKDPPTPPTSISSEWETTSFASSKKRSLSSPQLQVGEPRLMVMDEKLSALRGSLLVGDLNGEHTCLVHSLYVSTFHEVCENIASHGVSQRNVEVLKLLADVAKMLFPVNLSLSNVLGSTEHFVSEDNFLGNDSRNLSMCCRSSEKNYFLDQKGMRRTKLDLRHFDECSSRDLFASLFDCEYNRPSHCGRCKGTMGRIVNHSARCSDLTCQVPGCLRIQFIKLAGYHLYGDEFWHLPGYDGQWSSYSDGMPANLGDSKEHARSPYARNLVNVYDAIKASSQGCGGYIRTTEMCEPVVGNLLNCPVRDLTNHQLYLSHPNLIRRFQARVHDGIPHEFTDEEKYLLHHALKGKTIKSNLRSSSKFSLPPQVAVEGDEFYEANTESTQQQNLALLANSLSGTSVSWASNPNSLISRISSQRLNGLKPFFDRVGCARFPVVDMEQDQSESMSDLNLVVSHSAWPATRYWALDFHTLPFCRGMYVDIKIHNSEMETDLVKSIINFFQTGPEFPFKDSLVFVTINSGKTMSRGAVKGDSFGLALVAAIFGLPSGPLLTGSVDGAGQIHAVGEVVSKAIQAMANNVPIFLPREEFDDMLSKFQQQSPDEAVLADEVATAAANSSVRFKRIERQSPNAVFAIDNVVQLLEIYCSGGLAGYANQADTLRKASSKKEGTTSLKKTIAKDDFLSFFEDSDLPKVEKVWDNMVESGLGSRDPGMVKFLDSFKRTDMYDAVVAQLQPIVNRMKVKNTEPSAKTSTSGPDQETNKRIALEWKNAKSALNQLRVEINNRTKTVVSNDGHELTPDYFIEHYGKLSSNYDNGGVEQIKLSEKLEGNLLTFYVNGKKTALFMPKLVAYTKETKNKKKGKKTIKLSSHEDEDEEDLF